MDESLFSILQAYYDIKHEKDKQAALNHPDLAQFRLVIFWDTDIKSINWSRSRSKIIRRILEMGNETEIKEIVRYYGRDQIYSEISQMQDLFPEAIRKIKKFL